MHATTHVYFVGNTMLAELTNLKDEITGILLPAAVVTAWIVKPDGTIFPDSTITVNVVTAGHYQGLFPHTLALLPDVAYRVIIRAETGAPTQRAEWTLNAPSGVRYA